MPGFIQKNHKHHWFSKKKIKKKPFLRKQGKNVLNYNTYKKIHAEH